MKKSDIIPEHRRLDFLEQVFWNVHDIIAVNSKLRDAFNKRQKKSLYLKVLEQLFILTLLRVERVLLADTF